MKMHLTDHHMPSYGGFGRKWGQWTTLCGRGVYGDQIAAGMNDWELRAESNRCKRCSRKLAERTK